MALKSGKPVYCDKTFAPTLEAAVRMFNLAGKYKTPLFTSSAHRFCTDLIKFMDEKKTPAVFCATTGPGDMVNYSIHQFEMLECVMGVGARECKAFCAENVSHIIYKYENNRFAAFTQSPNVSFTMHVSDGLPDGRPDKNPAKNSTGRSITVADYYMNFMKALFKFFTDKIPPVAREDTLEIMAMQQAGREALKIPDTWVKLSESRY
jgi:predicted dehydrogenase